MMAMMMMVMMIVTYKTIVNLVVMISLGDSPLTLVNKWHMPRHAAQTTLTGQMAQASYWASMSG